MNKNFSSFTNLYELSKTLRFELKPVWKTQDLLKQNNVFKKDIVVKNAYDKIKPFLDRLHKKFIDESLKNTQIDFKEAYNKWLEIEKTSNDKEKKKLKEEFKKIKSNLRKQIVAWFKKTWNIWKDKYSSIVYVDEKWKKQNYKIKWDWYNILMSETNLNILYEFFIEKDWWNEVLVEDYDWKKKNIFKIFKWFTTYFTNFNHSRDNFYKDDGKSWRIATRIIDENMIFFFKNKRNFDKFYLESDELKNKLQKILDNYWENLEEFFDVNNYNNCFTWEGINYYNEILWWKNLDNWKKTQWLNEIINLEKQAKFSEYKQKKKAWEELKFNKNNYPIFKELYKQILSEKESEESFLEIKDFEELKNNLINFKKQNKLKNIIAKKLINSLIEEYENYDFSWIYISKRPALHTISSKFFGPNNWGLIEHYLLEKIWKKNSNKKLELPDFISLENIKNSLEQAQKESDEHIFKKEFDSIEEKDLFLKFLKVFQNEFLNLIKKQEGFSEKLEKEILNLSAFDKGDKNKEKQIEVIKNYLDENLNIFRMMKYFALEKAKENKEADYKTEDEFYNEFKNFYTDNEIIPYYNSFRNFLTKKPYSTDKIKLNFENGTLVEWWDKNKEPDNFWSILKKDEKYYLVLQVYWRKNIFYTKKKNSSIPIEEAFKIAKNEDFFEKMEYKFLPDPKKMLPKVAFAKSNLELFNPSEEILKIKKDETFKTWNKFNKIDFEKLVNYYKQCLKKYPDWQVFDFNFSDTKNYKNLSDFYNEVELVSYKLNFQKVSKKYIEDNLENWNIYLFEIYNKDFAEGKIGKVNLHTMYFKWLFEEENLKNPILKLNWQAEIFRREASLKEKKEIITKSNKVIKIDWKEVFHNKRYAFEKLLFHCPIKLNFAKKDDKINDKIREYLAENKEVNIIWIDRWEKHLVYYTVINQNWKILDKWSFNKIKTNNQGKTQEKDYYEELVKREKERQESRWSWKTIWTIKELKEWYISQVVHKLAELIIKQNAIIVFEDLNSWFKRWRQKIERQVYQKFEKALIEKLNYLVFKDKVIWENGHYLNAYQLTSSLKTFNEIWKQTGIIFYTNPSYTSQTCPKCGFKKTIYLKYINLSKAKKELKEKIEKFYFDNEKNEFIFEYNNLKIHTARDRKRNISSEESWVKWWKTVDYNIVSELKNLLKQNDVDYSSQENLIEKIIEKNSKDLYKWVFYNFNMASTIRNSIIWDNSRNGDFISCPVCDFDSRKDTEIWVESWDANWAYNIARKGIIILNKINKFQKEKWDVSKMKWKDLFVSGDDWNEFLGKI